MQAFHGSVRSHRLLGVLVAIIAALALASPAAANVNGFEAGDGNQACNGAEDWACTAINLARADDGTLNVDDVFAEGSKEEEPASWVYNPDGTQAKADIRSMWRGFVENPDASSYLYLAFARTGGEGNAFVSFELNQATNTWTNGNGSVVPCRTDGDGLISYEIPSTGTQVTLKLYKWDGSGGPASCPDGATGAWVPGLTVLPDHEGSVNADAAITNTLPGLPIGSTLEAGTFGEAVLRMPALASALNFTKPCQLFQSVWAHTRASSAFSSKMQDHVLGQSAIKLPACKPAAGGTPPPTPAITAPGCATSASVTVTGTAEPGVQVLVRENGTTVALAAADPATGAWSATIAGASDGAHAYTARAVSSGGDHSGDAAPVSVTVDTSPDAATTITTPANGSSMLEGSLDLSGKAEPGTTVTVRDNGTVVGTAVAESDGDWTLHLDAVAGGTHAYTASASDGCNAGSDGASTITVTVPPPPATPTISAPGCATADSVTVSGTAEAGVDVLVRESGATVATTAADSDGDWSTTLTSVADGNHTYSARASGPTGQSGDSAGVSVTVDTSPDAATTITSPANGSNLAAGSLDLAGKAEPGTTVTVRDGGTVVGTAVADGDGDWTLHLDSVDLGSHAFTASASDGCNAGADGASTVTVVPPPATPTISVPGCATAASVTVSGTAEPGVNVLVRESGATVATTSADSEGDWSETLTGVADGSHTYVARASGAGGQSGDSAGASVTVDTSPDAATTISSPANGSNVATGELDLAGTAEPGTTVTVRDGGTVVGTALADAEGDWTLHLDSVDAGTHAFTASASDGCNAGSDGASTVTVVPPPATPTISAPGCATAGSVTVSGTADPGVDVLVREDAATVATTSADSEGDWSETLNGVADGDHTYAARASSSGGQSSDSAGVSVTVDTSPDAATTITTPAAGASLTAGPLDLAGTAEPGTTVTVRDGGTVVGTPVADSEGDWTLHLASVTAGEHVYTASASDGCNAGADGQRTATVTQPPATPPPGDDPQAPAPTVTPLVTEPAPAPITTITLAPTPDSGTEGGSTSQLPTPPDCVGKPFSTFVADKGLKLKRVDFKVDGKRVAVSRRRDGQRNFVAMIDPRKLTNGSHSLVAVLVSKRAGVKPRVVKRSFKRCGACTSRRSFRIRVRKPQGVKIVSARVLVNRKQVKVVTGKRLTALVHLVGLPKGRVRVDIRGLGDDGNTYSGTRYYRTCVKKQKSSRKIDL